MNASTFESSHVHTVYDAIASDFSRTRHSRWPFVEHFLESLSPSSLVLDAGTGNGKYLGVRSLLEWQGKLAHDDPNDDAGRVKNDLFNVGFDMSHGLLNIASAKGHEVVRGDCVDMSCWRRGAFDHAISIATIHHLATPERRMESIKQMILAILPPAPPHTPAAREAGRILIVVWSLEQDPALLGARSARRTTGGKKGAVEIEMMDHLLAQQRRDQGRPEEVEIPKDRGEESVDPAKGKDVFVPWEKQAEVVPRKKKEPTPRRKDRGGPTSTSQQQTAQEETSRRDDGQVRASGKSSRDDDSARAPASIPSTNSNASAESTGKVTSPSTTVREMDGKQEEPKPTFNRYYHLFSHYELSSLVQTAAESLGLAFEHPQGYPLEPSSPTGTGERTEWERYVRLEEERWERENWVVEIAVGWRRRALE